MEKTAVEGSDTLMRLYLARHGQSHANLARIMANRPPGPGLTELGIEQAHNLGKQLQGLGIAQVWSSTLRRAEETAHHAASELGLNYQAHADLLEFDCGNLEGKGDEASWAEHWRVDQLWAQGQHLERTGGGESLLEIISRVQQFMDSLEGPPALVVGHGGIFRVALPEVLGLPARFTRENPIANCGVIVVERITTQWKCLEWGEVKL